MTLISYQVTKQAKHQELVIGKSPRHRGLLIGVVETLVKTENGKESDHRQRRKRDDRSGRSKNKSVQRGKCIHAHICIYTCIISTLRLLLFSADSFRDKNGGGGGGSPRLLSVRMRLEDSSIQLRVGDGVVIENVCSYFTVF